jgi:hypothetical protein
LSDANKADSASRDHADGSTVALVADNTAKPKKRGDVNEPKRACTTFMLFSQVERVSVKAENPTATSAEMFKLLGEKWQAADADTKAKYAALYVKNKARADDARLAYTYAKASGFYEASFVADLTDTCVGGSCADPEITESRLLVLTPTQRFVRHETIAYQW